MVRKYFSSNSYLNDQITKQLYSFAYTIRRHSCWSAGEYRYHSQKNKKELPKSKAELAKSKAVLLKSKAERTKSKAERAESKAHRADCEPAKNYFF